MKVLLWHNSKGPAMVFLIPQKGKVTDSASVPGGPWPRPWQELSAKGHGISWADFSQSLTQRPPYFGWWSTEEVPGRSSAQQALTYLCGKAATSLVPEAG